MDFPQVTGGETPHNIIFGFILTKKHELYIQLIKESTMLNKSKNLFLLSFTITSINGMEDSPTCSHHIEPALFQPYNLDMAMIRNVFGGTSRDVGVSENLPASMGLLTSESTLKISNDLSSLPRPRRKLHHASAYQLGEIKIGPIWIWNSSFGFNASQVEYFKIRELLVRKCIIITHLTETSAFEIIPRDIMNIVCDFMMQGFYKRRLNL